MSTKKWTLRFSECPSIAKVFLGNSPLLNELDDFGRIHNSSVAQCRETHNQETLPCSTLAHQTDNSHQCTNNKEYDVKTNLKDETLSKYNCLTRAIKERKKVFIRYYSYNKGENDRIICPAEMFLFQDGWYVAAFCLKKNDIRHFELRRIIKLELLEETF